MMHVAGIEPCLLSRPNSSVVDWTKHWNCPPPHPPPPVVLASDSDPHYLSTATQSCQDQANTLIKCILLITFCINQHFMYGPSEGRKSLGAEQTVCLSDSLSWLFALLLFKKTEKMCHFPVDFDLHDRKPLGCVQPAC